MLLDGILLDCNRVCYLPMPSPFICDRTSFSLEQEERMVGKIFTLGEKLIIFSYLFVPWLQQSDQSDCHMVGFF